MLKNVKTKGNTGIQQTTDVMYFYSFVHAPLPGGSFATHPAHAVFNQVLAVVCVVDLAVQVYTFYLMLRVATKQLSEYRFFMMLCMVGTGSRPR